MNILQENSDELYNVSGWDGMSEELKIGIPQSILKGLLTEV
jgi:hypothetical protein